LSAPGVPAKAAAAPAPARAGASRASPGPISPGRTTQTAAVAPRSASWAQASSDSSAGMRKGTVEAFNAAGTIQVYGQKLTFNPQTVKVFSAGKPGSVFTVKNGSNIRFTLDPTDLKRRRIAVIYTN
jgi:hypothetical protein